MTVAAVLPAASELMMLYGGRSRRARSRVASPSSGTRSSRAARLPRGRDRRCRRLHARRRRRLAIGYYGGHPLLERYGRYIHVTPARIARAERWFARFQELRSRSGSRRRSSGRSSRSPPGSSRCRCGASFPSPSSESRSSARRSPASVGRSDPTGIRPAMRSGTWTSWSRRVSSHWRSSGSSAGGARKHSPRVPDPSSPSRVSADRTCQWPRFRTSTSRLSTSRSFLS